MKHLFFILALTMLVGLSCTHQQNLQVLPGTRCTFETSDTALQSLYNIAVAKENENIRKFTDKYTVLVEGGEYGNVWIETQPMGGAMFAKHNLEVARNNQLIFMDFQLQSGQISSMIGPISDYQYVKHLPALQVTPDSNLFYFTGSIQGYCFPEPALEVFYWLGKDTAYLNKLYKTLEAFDGYLWKTRDSDGDGCLEDWCVTDNGEDNSIRFYGAPNWWQYDYPPTAENLPKDTSIIKQCWDSKFVKGLEPSIVPVPYESMDEMAYSYTGRMTLSKIAAIVNNGKTQYWLDKANEVKEKVNQYLWRPEKNAYYDRDKNNKFLETLIHNNIRMMYFGTMDQAMADAFIKEHLLNPAEFWTPMPLPTIAANDKLFRNEPMNNWSGQPQGLTYQRSVQSFENYGHYAEVSLVGKRLLSNVSKSRIFCQQFDPYTGIQNGRNGYGPTILAVLEYYAHMYSVYMKYDTLYWCGMPMNGNSYTFTQKWGNNEFVLSNSGEKISGTINGKMVFDCTPGVRVVTDLKGKLVEIAGIDTMARQISLSYNGKTYTSEINPNQVLVIGPDGSLVEKTRAPFDYPFKRE